MAHPNSQAAAKMVKCAIATEACDIESMCGRRQTSDRPFFEERKRLTLDRRGGGGGGHSVYRRFERAQCGRRVEWRSQNHQLTVVCESALQTNVFCYQITEEDLKRE